MKRWVLLHHTYGRDAVSHNHFDLLLEDQDGCRTWRLDSIPVIDGMEVPVKQAPIHKLEWLDRIESAVSGNRGWARRVERGTFSGLLPASQNYPIVVNLFSKSISGRLVIRDSACRIFSIKA